jgi:hypothetical protein
VRIYAMACAAHFHYDRLIAQFKATRPAVSEAGSESLDLVAPGSPTALGSGQDARAAAD